MGDSSCSQITAFLYPENTGHWTWRMNRHDCLFQQRHCVAGPATVAKNRGHMIFQFSLLEMTLCRNHRVPMAGDGALLLLGERVAGKEKAHSHYKCCGTME